MIPIQPEGPVGAWRALGERLPPGILRLVLADVDGVITGGEGQPADLDVLDRLAAHNRAALSDPLLPAITLCTGRQAPYVEVMAQMIEVFLPCIFEHGCGLFFPRAFRYAFHPSLGQDYSANLARLRAAIEEPLLRPGRAFVQPGKEASMTLYPLDGTPLDELERAARAAVAPLHGRYGVARNVNGVEVRPTDMDKAVGAHWLAEQVGVPLADMAGVGDSDTDLSFLAAVAWSAAPANATPAVRAAVAYVATQPLGEGLLEILERVVAHNRERAAA